PVGVEGRDGHGERAARRGRRRQSREAEGGRGPGAHGRGQVHGQSVGRVRGGDSLVPGRLEYDRKRVGPAVGGGERVIGGQTGLAVAAAEVDRAPITRGRVAGTIHGGDGDAGGGAGRNGRRQVNGQVEGGNDRDAGLRSQDAVGRVGGGQGLSAGS